MLHFFGDVHQPLHTENLSRGGNDIDVLFDGQKHNLHSVWDTLIPKKIVERAGDTGVFGNQGRWDLRNETEAAYAWAEFLYARYGRDTRVAERVEHVCVHDAVECALRWAGEANAYVCSYVMAGGLGELESKDLGEGYFDGAVPIVEEMIVKGGRRLARWLMMIAQDLAQDATIGSNDQHMFLQEL